MTAHRAYAETVNDFLRVRRASLTRLAVGIGILVCVIASMPHIVTPDFLQDYAAACGWLHGQSSNAPTADLLRACDVHLDSPFVQTAHPPFATLISLPFALFPWPVARLLWCLCGWGIVLWSWQALQTPPEVCLATAALWVFGLLLGAFEPLLYGLFAATLLLQPQKPRFAGIALGIAAALKLYPVVLIGGLWLCRQRGAATTALVVAAAATVLGEGIFGPGATRDWLRFTPLNIQAYVDVTANLSLVRLVRAVLPNTSPLLATLVLGVLLILPLLAAVRRSDSIRPLIALMLLISSLSWPHYCVYLSLGQLTRFEQLCLAGAGSLLVLAWLGLIPNTALAPFGYTPLLAVLLLVWYRQRRAPVPEIQLSDRAA